MKWKTICGGSWRNDPRHARVAYRFWFPPGARGDDYLGLRLVRRKR